ncbi:MAG: tetratricopeptide repeat protein, partial [Bacteroidales bacterium]|nr:tetratricopeptide repeat protein [Bacteroidales bacterium]
MRKLLTVIALALVAFTASAQADRHEVRQGNRLFKAGKFEAADISYRKAQLKDSTSFAAGYNLANALYREGNYDEAGKQLSKLSSKAKGRPDEASFWFNAGDVAIQKKDWKTAVDAFHASLLLNPSDIDAKENYLYAKKMLENQQQEEQNQQDQDQDQNQDQQQQQQ